ncbi:hypothetical protein DAI22_12g103600 [Oryza sativa Japonica Group]|nr:hypothetical protein DAI22_12g103600 [Oryza sativa Japonica Group]
MLLLLCEKYAVSWCRIYMTPYHMIILDSILFLHQIKRKYSWIVVLSEISDLAWIFLVNFFSNVLQQN